MDDVKSDESILSELEGIPDFKTEKIAQVEVLDGEDLIPVQVTVRVQFKSGHTRDISLDLPVKSEIVDGMLTSANILDYVGSAYAFSEGAFLALPTGSAGSHIFIELSSTDFIEVLR